MSILGIGTDLVEVARIEAIWKRFGMNFARRILTQSELRDLQQTKNPVPFLAKRFAAKEAVAKALGTGFRPQGLLLTEIGVRNDGLGRPHLEFSGNTKTEIERQGVLDAHLSLSDEREYALAFVVLERVINQEAWEGIQRGLKDAAEGRISSLGSFAKYLNDDHD